MRDVNLHTPSAQEQDKQFKLPESPWTYGEGFNPGLRATNAAKRRKVADGGDEAEEGDNDDNRPLGYSTASYTAPPYHPSSRPNQVAPSTSRRRDSVSSHESYESSVASMDSAADFAASRPDASDRVDVRLGDEGWEVRPRMMTYGVPGDGAFAVPAEEAGVAPGDDRYRRYVTEESSEEDEDDEEEEVEDEWDKMGKSELHGAEAT